MTLRFVVSLVQKKNKEDILIHFLNDILGFTGKDEIKEIEFGTYSRCEIASKKQSILDILCIDENGLQVIVEMQVAKTKSFEKRAQYYAAKAYLGRLIRVTNMKTQRNYLYCHCRLYLIS